MADLFAQRVELKFTIDPSLSQAIRQWSIDKMQRDDNNPDVESNSYSVASLYLDTPKLDIFHRTPRVTKTKHRLRQYGSTSSIYVETKKKSEDIVTKRRAMLTADEATHLFGDTFTFEQVKSNPVVSESLLPRVGWFCDRVFQYDLIPSTFVRYERSRGSLRSALMRLV